MCSSVALKIVDVHRVLHDVVAELVGLAMGVTRLDAAAGHPPREAAAVMVAADERVVDLPLRERRAAELAAEHHQRVVEQPALLQIHDQRRARLIDLAARIGKFCLSAR